MKTQAIIAGSILTVANGAALIPTLEPYASYATPASLAVGLWLMGRAALTNDVSEATPVEPAPVEPEEPVGEPVIPEAPEKNADADVVTLLGVFQEKGRLVDFLMDDIKGYSDSQVGAAARVVHQGCALALKTHFDVAPVAEEKEGSQVAVPVDSPDGYFRLSGRIQGQGPFAGKLVHKGWKTASVKLPRVLSSKNEQLPAIAPAQVEV